MWLVITVGYRGGGLLLFAQKGKEAVYDHPPLQRCVNKTVILHKSENTGKRANIISLRVSLPLDTRL
jgi:hypothetical protein